MKWNTASSNVHLYSKLPLVGGRFCPTTYHLVAVVPKPFLPSLEWIGQKLWPVPCEQTDGTIAIAGALRAMLIKCRNVDITEAKQVNWTHRTNCKWENPKCLHKWENPTCPRKLHMRNQASSRITKLHMIISQVWKVTNQQIEKPKPIGE